jgi:hypothetical protein
MLRERWNRLSLREQQTISLGVTIIVGCVSIACAITIRFGVEHEARLVLAAFAVALLVAALIRGKAARWRSAISLAATTVLLVTIAREPDLHHPGLVTIALYAVAALALIPMSLFRRPSNRQR